MQFDEILADKHLELENIIKGYKDQETKMPLDLDAIEELLYGKKIEKQSIQQLIEIPEPEPQRNTYTNEEINQLLNQFEIDEVIRQSEKPKIVEQQQNVQYILDYVDQLEKEPYLITQKNEGDSDLIQQYENLKQSVNTFQEVKLNKKLQNLYTQINTKQNDHRIKCITCFANTIAFGTSKATIYTINLDEAKIIKLESDPSINICPIICLRYNEDGTLLIAITQQQILLYNKNKFCKAFSKIFDGIPTCASTFNNSDKKTFIMSFLICDSIGKVQLIKIRKNMLTYGIEKIGLLDGSAGSCHQCESARNKDLQIIAIALKESVFVITVEPCIELIFKRNYEKKKRQLIQVKWQIQTDQPLLLIGNGKQIDIIKMSWKIQGGSLGTNFEQLCSYELTDDIQYITWMSNNVIFIKHERKKYSLLSLSEILQQNVLIINAQLSFEPIDQTVGDDKISSYHNTFCQNHNQIYYIHNQENSNNNIQPFIHYCLINWQDYIQKLIQQHQWNECMASCLYLYKGKQLKFSGLPQNEMQDFLRPHLQDKLRQFVEIQIEHKQTQNVISTAIEFLVTIEAYEYLFQEIRNIFQINQLEKQFLNGLEPFILKNCIKFIPDNALRDLTKHLLNQQNKLFVLKQLIINLDIKLLDPIIIQQICIENDLFTPLIYISPRVDDDHKTPLFKMYAVYRQLIKGDQNAIEKYFKSLQIKLSEQQNIIDKEIKMLGYRCLWNLHLQLNGELFPYDKIDQNKWPYIIAEILSWLLQYDTLEEFYKIDSAIFLNELLIIFKDNNKYKSLEEYKNIISGDQLKTDGLSLSQIIIMLLEVQAQQQGIMDIFYTFMLEIMQINNIYYQINYSQLISVILFNFKNPYLKLDYFIDKSNYQFHNLEFKQSYEQSIEQKNQKDNVIIKYLNIFKEQLLKDQITLNKLQQEANLSLQSQLRIVSEIQYFQLEWQNCLQGLLSSQYLSDKIFIFDYIDRMMKDIEFEQKRDAILQFILQKIPQLVYICAEKLRQTLQYYNEEDYKIAIEMLESNPKLQLKLLSEIVASKRLQKQFVEDKIMVLFFKLICQFHPEQVYEQLLNGDFPQDECLKMCEQFKLLKGIAFLKERNGRFSEALDLYFDIIHEELKKIEIIDYDQQSQIEQIQMLVLPCLKICRENHSNEEESTNYWYRLVIRMVQLRQNYENSKSIFKSLNTVYQIMLEELLERVQLQSIISNLKILFASFTKLEELRKTFTRLLSSCSFEQYNQQQLNKVLHIDYLKNLECLYELQQQGQNFESICQTCDEKRDQTMLGFVSCHHIFHYGCAPKLQNIIVCDICLNEPSYKLKVQLESIVEKNSKIIPQIKMKQNLDETEETYTKEEIKSIRINKWKMYDIENELNQYNY